MRRACMEVRLTITYKRVQSSVLISYPPVPTHCSLSHTSIPTHHTHTHTAYTLHTHHTYTLHTQVDKQQRLNWNERFQQIVERPTTTPEEVDKRDEAVRRLYREFVACACPYIKSMYVLEYSVCTMVDSACVCCYRVHANEINDC